jgi:hypothetical protein
VTPSITTDPANVTAASVASTGITASVATNVIPGTTGTVAVGAGANAHKLIYTQVSGSVNPNAVMGTFSFTPSTSGYYVMTLTPAVTTASPSGTDTETFATAVAIGINVGGGSLVQAASGLGASTGTQAVGLNAAAAFHIPAGSTTASRYKIEATGAAINDARTITTVTDVTSATTFTATTGITTNTPSSYATGITFVGQASTTSVLTGTTVTDGVVVSFTSATAGSATVTMQSMNTTTGVLTTVGSVTVTFGAAPAISTAYSTAKLAYGNNCSTAATVPVVLARTAGVALAAGVTTGASLCIETKDQNDVALNGQSLSVTISGPGLIRLDDNTATGITGNVRTQSLTAASRASTSTAAIGITADGTAGVATITVTAGTTVIATKTVTFYGAVAKYTATVLQNITDDGVATTDAVLVAATDSAGIPVPGATIYAFSGSTAAATVPITATTVSSAGTLGGTAPTSYQAATPVGSAEVNVTGVSGTTAKDVTITFGNAATIATSTVTTTAVVKIGSIKASSIKVSTDKTSYAPGEAMKITFAMTDSLGRPTAAGAGTGLLDSVITSAALAGDALPTTAIASLTGSKTYTVFAPLSGGKVKITTTTGEAGTFVATAGADQVIATEVTITDPNAAIATSIASLNAKIVALNALIAKIMKRLNIR